MKQPHDVIAAKVEAANNAAVDPVCGMEVDPARAADVHQHDGHIYYFCSKSCAERFSAHPGDYVSEQHESVHRDPVCGMDVTASSAVGTVEYDGHTYYFCGPSCREKFENNPKTYVTQPPSQPKPIAASDVEYTCPMDPEVRQKGPGSCPKCGMALEP